MKLKSCPDHFYFPQKGDILYHYTSAEGAAAILNSNSFWLSEFSKMNDRAEYTYARDKFIEFYKCRDVFVEEIPRYTNTFMRLLLESRFLMLIGCVTRARNDCFLWEHYANNGTGCVIGLDASWLEKRAGVTLRRVSYDPQYMKDYVNSGLSMLQEHYEDHPTRGDELKELASFFSLDLFAFKDPQYSSEQEIRISRLTVIDESFELGIKDAGGHTDSGKAISPLPIYSRGGQYGNVPYIELPLGDKARKTSIKSVGFGPRFSEDHKQAFLSSVRHHNSIKFWSASAQ